MAAVSETPAASCQRDGHTFDIFFGGNQSSNLQQSFQRYRKERQAEMRQCRKMRELNQLDASQCSIKSTRSEELRRKFVEQAKKYLGVPYAKKYWTSEEPEYGSPTFLDCCGLVRRVLHDLKEDFGFTCGRWNQAYHFDTLPTTLVKLEDAKPGDLVFILATYNNPKNKKQRHNVVHVEILLGEGEKTIGARWQRGHVQVFDSYAFEPKAYHSPVYVFKSIETWLNGECRSHCPEHAWRVSEYDPSAKSIFALRDEDDDAQSAGDTDDELVQSLDFLTLDECADSESTVWPCSRPSVNEDCPEPIAGQWFSDGENKENKPHEADTPPDDGGGGDSSLPPAWSTTASDTGKPQGTRRRGGGGDKKPDPNENNNNNAGPGKGGGKGGSHGPPLFYIAGGNGASLVEAPLVALGWRRTSEKSSDNWKLKWVELNSSISWTSFKDGEQLVNRIPNCHLLTNKLGLYNSLSEYHRVTMALKSGRVKLKLDEFVPETYRIDESKDRSAFLAAYQEGDIWICKPTGLNQGKGIYLVRSREEIDNMLSERDEKRSTRRTKPPMSRIIQRYITKPLLVEGRKFDIRCYMLIACTVPYLVLYHRGYVRVTCDRYYPESTDLTNHLTNQFMQKKREDYKEMKDDTVWSMERLNKYINENCREKTGIEEDWVHNTFDKKCMAIMKYCFNSVKHKLSCRQGYFDLYGFDFMIGQDMGVWLIEVNVNPALHVNCEILKEVIPPIIEQTIHAALECFEKGRKSLPLLPLQSLRTFEILYNGDKKSGGGGVGLSGDNTPIGTMAQGSSPKPRRSASPSKDQPPAWGYIGRTSLKPSHAVGLSLPITQPGVTSHSAAAAATSGEAGAVSSGVNAISASMAGMYVISSYASAAVPATAAVPSSTAPSIAITSPVPSRIESTADVTASSRSPVSELADMRSRTPRLPPLYNVRTDVSAGRLHDEGGVARLRLVHAEHQPTAEQGGKSGGGKTSRRAPVDRSS